MERQITPEQFEKVRVHMRDTYDVAEHEWDEEELIEAIYDLLSKDSLTLEEVERYINWRDTVPHLYNGYKQVYHDNDNTLEEPELLPYWIANYRDNNER